MAHVIQINDYVRTEPEAGLLARLWKRVTDLRAYLAIREELAMMSDRDLADLGISRYDIRSIARTAVYGA